MRSLAGQLLDVSIPLIITSGLTAYIISSWMLVVFRLVGVTSYAPRVYWACGLFGSLRGIALFAGRIIRALALGLAVPLCYAVIFELVGNAELPLGAALGLGHALVVGIALPVVAGRNGCRSAPPPGLFGWRLGALTPLAILIAYGLYGAALGYVYVVVSA